MGDLSCIMPVIHPYVSGATGTSHGSDYYITNPTEACVDSARWQLSMLYLLLCEGAKEAKRVKAEAKPLFASKEDYFAYVDAVMCEGDRIVYNEDGSATVR